MKKTFSILLIFAACLYAGNELCFIFKKAGIQTQILARARYSYANIRDMLGGSLIAKQAQEHLPEGAAVELPDADGITRVSIRYELYPVKVEKNANYVLVLKPDGQNAPPSGQAKHLSRQAQLFSRADHAFASGSAPPSPSLGIVACFSLAMALLNILFGRLLLSLFAHGRTSSLSASYLTGFLTLTAALWLWLLGGGTLTRFSLSGIWIALLLIVCGFKAIVPLKVPPERLPTVEPGRFRILFVLTALPVLAVFAVIISYPVTNWDAMSHWILKSKILFHGGKLDFSYTHNNYYPLLWPLNIAAQFTLLGGMFDECAKWTSGFFFLAFISQFAVCLKNLRIKKPFFYAIIPLFLAIFFHDLRHHPWRVHFAFANAQNIFIAYLAGFLAAVIPWLQGRRNGSRPLVLITACGLCLTKLEGSLFVLLSLLALITLTDKTSRRFFASLLLPIGLSAAWVVWNKHQGFYASVYHFSAPINGNKIAVLTRTIARQMAASESFYLGVLGLLTAKFWATRPAWRDSEKFLAQTGAAWMMFTGASVLGWEQAKIPSDFLDVSSRLCLSAAIALTLLWASRMFSEEKT